MAARSILLAVFLMLLPFAAMADEIGKADKVVNGVFGDHLAYPIKAQQRVRQDEQISTTNKSATSLLFDDGTALDLGPNAEIVLDNFVYDPATRRLEGAIRMSKGLMRFVGSKSPKQIEIETSVAVLGIRGTIFNLSTDAQSAEIQVLEGNVSVTSGSGSSVLEPGDFVRIAAGSPPVPATPSQTFTTGLQSVQTMIGPPRRLPDGASAAAEPVKETRPLIDVRDQQGVIVGHLVTHDDGKIDAIDMQKLLRATYDPVRNQTLDPKGRVIGQGNQLAELLGGK